MLRLGEGVGDALSRTLGGLEGASDWQSATPYVAPRLLKKSGKDSLIEQVRLECQRRGLPELERCEFLPFSDEPTRRLRHFVLHDARHSPPHPTRFALRIRFVEPVTGPICLGYGAHAGLGRFEVVAELP
jgi:CRISPR-associated protein Csb2